MLSSINKLRRSAALIAAAVMLLSAVLAASACAKKPAFKVPDGMTREEAALFTAVANVCPKDDNHSKMEKLTFRIEGWSFDAIPQPILDYLQEYCFAGGAAMMQFSDEQLRQLGYVAFGDGGFFAEDELVYAEGKGKIFTFTLGEDQDTEQDSVLVSVTGWISEKDNSGFDVELDYVNGEWKFVKNTNAWNYYQFVTEDPNATYEPQK